jgi:putative ABC transport system permease protein
MSPAGPHPGGVPARRAAMRWAWRLLQPEWSQQLLALALIVVTMAVSWLLAGR